MIGELVYIGIILALMYVIIAIWANVSVYMTYRCRVMILEIFSIFD
jgi:hypothetical protein